MKQDPHSHGLCQIGAILAVFVLVFAGCSNPAGTNDTWNSDELPMQMLEALLGFEIIDNEDGTYTIPSSVEWDGRIPVPEGFEPDPADFPSRYIIEGQDGKTYLDLFALEDGEFISLPILSMEISITRADDYIVVNLPGDVSYYIIFEGDGSYTIRLTDRHILNNFITDFESRLLDEGFSFIDDKWYMSLPYQDEELAIPLPDIPEDFILGITENGYTIEITGFPILLPLVEGENTITIKVSLGKEESVYVKLAVDMAYFVPITGITLNPEELILIVGLDDGEEFFNVEPVIEPANATNKLIEWITSDDSVVTVDAGGKLIGQNSGTAVITAAAKHPRNIDYETNTIEVTVGDLRLTNLKAAYTRPKDGEIISDMPFELEPGISVENGVTTVDISFEKDEGTESSFEVDTGLHLTKIQKGTDFTVGNLIVGTNQAYIKLSVFGYSKTYTVKIIQLMAVTPAESVSLNKNSLALFIGETETLLAEVKPDGASDKRVTWSSNNAAATVDSAGKVTAVGAGTATITVMTVDGNKTAACTVTVSTVPVAGIALHKSSITLPAGGVEPLVATVNPANATNKAVNWSSSAESIATVSSNGTVSGVTIGTAVITARSAENNEITAVCTVNVIAVAIPVTSISIDKSSLDLKVGETGTFSATVLPTNATIRAVAWSSSNSAVAIVDSEGNVTAVGVGNAAITARTVDGNKEVSRQVTVSAVQITKVELHKKTLTLPVGGEEPLVALISPDNATNKAVNWSSSSSGIAAVSSNGIVTGVSAGTATITVRSTADSSKTDTCTVTVVAVTVPVISVVINEVNMSLLVGGKASFTATVSPSNASIKTVIWSSNRSDIAIVDSDGNVTAMGVGTATITAKTVDGEKTANRNVTVNPIAVTGVLLNKATTDIGINGTERLFATVNPENATNKGITWSSSATAVATVANDGTVTGRAVGTAVITARSAADSAIAASCTVNVIVPTIRVTGVTLNKTTTALSVGNSETLTATVNPGTASIKAVEWTSSNSLVASVNSAGNVTGVSAGSAVITVRTVDGDKEATCTVTVSNVSVTRIDLNTTSLTSLPVGDTYKLIPTVTPSNATNKTVTWSSNNTSRATVDSEGNVTAVAAGSVTITATSVSNPGVTRNCSVTVTNVAVTSVSLDRTTLSLVVGETYKLVPTVAPANATNKAVTWSSNSTGRATVDSEGNVTAVAAGSVTITATSVSNTNRTATCTITVTNVAVSSITLNTTTLSLLVGDTYKLIPTVNPTNATNKAVTWSSNNNGRATVDSEGNVTAVGAGTVTITAASAADSTKTASCTVNVIMPTIRVTGVTLNKNTTALFVGNSEILTATVSPGDASIKAVEWTSSNSLVASVDSSGKVMGVSAGTAIIKVRTADGDKEATCNVTVNNVAVTGITISPTSLSLLLGNTSKLVPTVTPDNATNKSVTWSSSNNNRVSVDSEGNVTAVSTGTGAVTITARSVSETGVTATCAVTVTTIAVTSISLDKTTLSLVVGEKYKLVPTVTPDNATNKSVTWSSSNNNRVSVDSEGNVTAVSTGSGAVTITARSVSETGVTTTCAVTVIAATVPVSGVTLSPGSVTIKAGNTTTLTPTIAPANASNNNVTWSSNNTAVATVANSVVTGVKGGTATITVTTADGGWTATCTVTVEDNAAVTFEWAEAGVSLTPSPSTLTINQGGTVTITAPPGLGSYAWYVDSKIVNGVASNVFIFDSTGRPKGRYTVSLWAGNSVGGDAIQIIVQ